VVSRPRIESRRTLVVDAWIRDCLVIQRKYAFSSESIPTLEGFLLQERARAKNRRSDFWVFSHPAIREDGTSQLAPRREVLMGKKF
jgi:hypothetical protein